MNEHTGHSLKDGTNFIQKNGLIIKSYNKYVVSKVQQNTGKKVLYLINLKLIMSSDYTFVI